MAGKLKSDKRIVRERIAQLRVEKKMSQKDFAAELSNLSLDGKLISQANVSMWEGMKRNVPLEHLPALAQLFDVEEPYLLGLTDDRHITYEELEAMQPTDKYEKYEIAFWQLYAYDRQPVFVNFENIAHHESGWAIYNRQRACFVFGDDVVKEVTCQRLGAKYYTTDLSRLNDGLQQRKSLDYEKFLNTETMYIQMITTDRYIRGLYDGWYHHNETHTAIINEQGNVLPYSGLKKSYYAYSYRFKYDEQIESDDDVDVVGEPLEFPSQYN